MTCDGVIANAATPAPAVAPGRPAPATGGYPLTIYDQAAQFQPVGGSNAYTPANYSQNPVPAIVTIDPGATLTATITTANRTMMESDNGLIVANYSNSENPAVNNVIVNNSGTITLANGQSASRISAIVSDSQVNSFTVNNTATGKIISNQTSLPFTTAFNPALLRDNPSTATATAPSTYTAQYAGANFGITSGLYSDDNTNTFVLNNAGSLTAAGHFATTSYGRADTTVTNTGTIANTDWTPTDTIAAGHWAIAAYAGTNYTAAPNTNPDSTIVIPNANGSVSIDGTSALTVKNSGLIKGDILALDITPLVYAAAVAGSANPFANPTQTTLLQLPVSSSNAGPRDSNIVNTGAIQGNLYLGSGTHNIHNDAGATWQGSVYVDQRPFQASFAEPNPGTVPGTYISKGGTDFNGNACPAAAQNTNAGCATTSNHIATVVGGQSFKLVNQGTLTGDIRIFDEATSVNKIRLFGTGFAGNVVAVNGTGSNTLVLDGVTNLASVQNFSDLGLRTSNVAVTNGVSLVNNAKISTTIYGRGGTEANPSTNLGSIQGSLTLKGTTKIVPKIETIVNNGSVYQLATQATAAGPITVRGTKLVGFTADTSTGALNLRADVRNAASVAPGITTPGAQTIDGLTSYTGSNRLVEALGTEIENLHSGAAIAAAGNALSPTVNGADIQTPINSAMLFHQQVDSRLDTFLYGQIPASGRSADLGVARPAPVYGVVPPSGAWIEGVGGGVHQSTVAGVNGYTADLTGVIGGYDRLIAPAFRVGGAFGYIDGRVNNNLNQTGTREDIQTYQGLVYAAYEGPRAYLRGSFGYGGVDFNSQRNISFGTVSDAAFGSHSGNILTARGEGGVPVEVRDNLLVPYAAFTYSHLDQNAYQEQSSFGAGFGYRNASNDSDRSEVGGKAIVPIGILPVFTRFFPAGAVAAIEARAAYVHEFGNVAQDVSASFTGGNSFLVTGPTPNRDMVDYNVGLRVATGRVQIDASYNGLARSNYLEQIGLLRARFLF